VKHKNNKKTAAEKRLQKIANAKFKSDFTLKVTYDFPLSHLTFHQIGKEDLRRFQAIFCS